LGITTSLGLFLHNYRLLRLGQTSIKKVIDRPVFGFLGVSGLGYYWCRKEEMEKRGKVRADGAGQEERSDDCSDKLSESL